MKTAHDFSKGVRGKFYNHNGEFNLPIYLEPEVDAFVHRLSVEKNVDRTQIVTGLLK